MVDFQDTMVAPYSKSSTDDLCSYNFRVSKVIILKSNYLGMAEYNSVVE
jgi:hypothetical protein